MSRGKGELAVQVKNSAGTVVGESTCFLEIKDVKEMYERWTLGDAPNPPLTNAVLYSVGHPTGTATQFSDSTGSGLPYILLIHGWNMIPWEKDAFAETAFKRLYWQGYAGRFGALYWPTLYGFSDNLLDNPGPIFYPHHYNQSEFTAWRSGEGARGLMASLNSRYPGKVYVVAHSMGNVVAGEALALQAEQHAATPVVNTYVASQAAVPMQCYNATNNAAYDLNFQYQHPAAPLNAALPMNWDSKTLNVYPAWLATNRVACITRVNFYNPRDYALAPSAWQFNQLFKPTEFVDFVYSYKEAYSSLPPKLTAPPYSHPNPNRFPSAARQGVTPSGFRNMQNYYQKLTYSNRTLTYFDWEYKLWDMYEVMAYAAEARTIPLGACDDAFSLDSKVNLTTVWQPDENPGDDGTYSRHLWHSAQFRSINMRQHVYWQTLLSDRGFNLQ